MFIVYAIKSEINDRIYIGQTNDIEHRLHYHNSGYVKSTKRDKPWIIIAKEYFDSRNDARWKEHKLKKSKGAREKWLKTYTI